MRLWIVLAGLNGMLGVAAGAWGTHGALDETARQWVATASHYQLTHALALTAVAWLSTRNDVSRVAVALAGSGFALGIILFSGSLYALAATGMVPVRGAAPVGGMMLMAAWALLAVAALHRRSQPSPS